MLLFATNYGFAQLSDLHYLPPLKQGQNNAAIEQQGLYLSTPETTAFLVNVYRGTNTTPITTFNISKTNPAIYNPGNGNNNITLVDNFNTGVVLTNSGLRFEAPGGQNFYVNYRGQSAFQAASLTSKGRIALGTRFRWGGVPNLGSENSKSNTLGIMATENNTVITLSGYDSNCEFRVGNNRAGITDDSYTITLDENESFVFETYIGDTPTLAHERGWIGAAIASDKDIVISNGSLNYGREAGSPSRDAGIDQPVPENRLGKEYVFIRGNGNANGWTEFPLIIATQNNTQIFVNGSATPIATINKGNFFEIPSSYFSANTVGSNMHVELSKNAYAYQCVGGSTDAFTQGLNFVAPVTCLLPDTMDNIPDIRDIAGVNITGGLTIIAAAATPDSDITVIDGNGTVTLSASSAVTGSSDWKTFYLPNLTGDVSVQSTGSIAVGFFGFNSSRGVAGYYSGFDNLSDADLQISGTTCLPGAFLEITGGKTFDAYQWYDDIGLITGETSPTFSPTVAGDYFLRVTKGSCSYDSNPITVYYCNPDIVVNKTVDTNTALEGETVNFTINLESLGLDPVTNSTVTDVLPSGFTFVSASPSKGTWSTPNWSVGTLNAGDRETIIVTATVDDLPLTKASQTLTNTVTHTQDQTDTNITADSPSVSVQVDSDNDYDGVLDVDDLDDDNDGILDTIECSGGAPCIDTDDDGIPDYLDTDSDNDSCSDADEAYSATGTDSNNDGTYGGAITDADVNANGLVVSAGVNGAGDSYTTTPASTSSPNGNTFQIATRATVDASPLTDQFVGSGDSASFTIASASAESTQTFTSGNPNYTVSPATNSSSGLQYQWQENGANLSNGGIYSGAMTNTLNISDVTGLGGTVYNLVVTHADNVCIRIENSAMLNLDSDEDGVEDTIDLDDDNDGILDTVEVNCDPPVLGFDAYWPLNNSTADISGNSHDQVGGSISFSTTGRCGLASASFNGSTEYIQYSDGTFLNQGITNFTYSFWVKPNSLSGNQTLLDEGGSGNGLAIRLNNNNLQSAFREGGTQINIPTVTFPNDGLWHHIALTYESGTVILYLDGLGTAPLNTGFGPLAGHGSPHAFGYTTQGDGFGPGNGNYYDGLMDEILHYPISLTQVEINALFTEIQWDTDNDGIADYLDTDSDDDGCSDADEAYATAGTDSNNDGTYGGTITNTEVNANGLVVFAGINGAGDTYNTTPAISTISTNYTFQEFGVIPSISIQPDDERVLLTDNGTFDLTANGDAYQWQVSSDTGSTYTTINDGLEYSGTSTATLTIISPDSGKHGYVYRVILSNTNFVCEDTVSNAAVLYIGPGTVISNRRVTFRVKRN